MCPIFAHFCLQNIKIPFEYADFYAKISLILDTSAKKFHNPTDINAYVTRQMKSHVKRTFVCCIFNRP